MKNKKLIFSVLFTGILFLNTFLFTNINENKLQLNSLFTLAAAQYEFVCVEGEFYGYLLPEASITCDAPRYGKCNALFVHFIPDHPMVFLCEFTGEQDDNCEHWEEVVCTTSGCIIYLASLGLL